MTPVLVERPPVLSQNETRGDSMSLRGLKVVLAICLANLCAISVWANDRVFHSVPSKGNLPTDIRLPPFNPGEAREAIYDILQKYRASNGANWTEIESDLGAEVPRWGRPGAGGPAFNRANVDKAVTEISAEITARPPATWQELSALMAKYRNAIPDTVVKDVVRGQVDKAKEESGKDKSGTPGSSPDGNAKNTDGNPLPQAGTDRGKPNRPQALERNLNPGADRFSGFRLAPSATASNPTAPVPTRFGKFQPPPGVPNGRGAPSISAYAPPPQVPGATGAVPTPSSVKPDNSDDAKRERPDSEIAPKKENPSSPSSTLAESALSARLDSVPPSADGPDTEVQASPLDSLLNGAAPPEVGNPFEEPEPRKVALQVGESAPEGTGANTVSAFNDTSEGILEDNSFWALFSQWMFAGQARAGAPIQREPAQSRRLVASDLFWEEHPGWSHFAALLDETGLSLDRNHRDRLIASLSEGTGLDADSAIRLYYVVLASAWAATALFLSWLVWTYRPKRRS